MPKRFNAKWSSLFPRATYVLVIEVAALTPMAMQPALVRAQTETQAATLYPQRTLAFEADGVQISNDFAGGAFADVRRAGPDHYEVIIAPENKPINRSPWYAFKITAQEPRTITVTLKYAHARHRYYPKISIDGKRFTPIDREHYHRDAEQGSARLSVRVGSRAVWIAAQELFTSQDYKQWMDRLAEHPAVSIHEIGESMGGRALHMLTIGEDRARQDAVNRDKRFVLLFGRQHPPEVSGGVAMRAFVETLTDDSELAHRFREAFVVLVVPLINPDGVDRGLWRHNFGGTDLNRDWGPFRQLETRLVRDAILERLPNSKGRVLVGIDFHSTFRNVFYTPSKEADVQPEGFVADWLQAIRQAHPDVKLPESASHNVRRPTAKAWFVERFGAPGITYEVADDFDRDKTRAIARTAAEALMRLLLAELRETP